MANSNTVVGSKIKGIIPKPFIDANAYPPMVVELKWNKTADAAIAQIKNRKYPDALEGFDSILLVGINYDKDSKEHECVIEKFKPWFVDQNKALYRFYNYDPINQLALDDGTTKIFLYIDGQTDREELSNFMQYLKTGKTTDSLTEDIDDEVKRIRESSEAFIEYIDTMIHEKEIREKSKEEGSLNTLIELVKEGNLSIEVASCKANMTVEEFQKRMEEWKK